MRDRIEKSKARRDPIEVDAAGLEDLARRLASVRWPEATRDDWELGTSASYLRELVEYWMDGFDWRARVEALEAVLPSYRVPVGGLDLHFAYRAGRGPDPFPLLLSHGWPGSHFEMSKVAGPLADPEAHGGDPRDAFDLIVPSLPGHGFSSAPEDPFFGADEAADAMRELMVDVLGYSRFGAQGGDRGAFVSASLGHRHPEHVAGIHLNMVTGIPAPEAERPPEETAWLEAQARWQRDGAGYSEIQGTRPQTLAFALSDSPVGLASWIVEKWRAWSDCEGDVERRFTKDELLTNVMIYWVTGTIHASMRQYAGHRSRPPAAVRPVRIDVPTGVADFPKEVVRAPRSAVERKFDLVQWTEMSSGGHFAAMEEPAALVEDVRAFFRKLRRD